MVKAIVNVGFDSVARRHDGTLPLKDCPCKDSPFKARVGNYRVFYGKVLCVKERIGTAMRSSFCNAGTGYFWRALTVIIMP